MMGFKSELEGMVKNKMSQIISLDQLPRQAECLLRAVWEERETVLLEHNGEPVAAVVPMDDYQRLYLDTEKAKRRRRKAKTKAEPPAPSLAYELPADVLEAYHRFVSKKLMEGLTPDEEAEFARIDKVLDEADMATPLERAADARARREHERQMATLDDIIAQLKSLLQEPQ